MNDSIWKLTKNNQPSKKYINWLKKLASNQKDGLIVDINRHKQVSGGKKNAKQKVLLSYKNTLNDIKDYKKKRFSSIKKFEEDDFYKKVMILRTTTSPLISYSVTGRPAYKKTKTVKPKTKTKTVKKTKTTKKRKKKEVRVRKGLTNKQWKINPKSKIFKNMWLIKSPSSKKWRVWNAKERDEYNRLAGSLEK
jgi:hypothetical protein